MMFQVKEKRTLGEKRSVDGRGKWTAIAGNAGVVLLLSAITLVSFRRFFDGPSVHASRAVMLMVWC